MWRGPRTPTAAIITAHELHGLILQYWHTLKIQYDGLTTTATFDRWEDFDFPTEIRDTTEIVDELKTSFSTMAQTLLSRFVASFGVDLADQLEFLKTSYASPGSEQTFFRECTRFLKNADEGLAILTDTFLQTQPPENDLKNWKHARHVQYVMHDKDTDDYAAAQIPLRMLVLWQGTTSYVEAKPSQFYPEDAVLQQALSRELSALDKGLATPQDGLFFDWRTGTAFEKANAPVLPEGFAIEREFYDTTYLISFDGEDMKLTDVGALLGSLQLRDFKEDKAEAIRKLMQMRFVLEAANKPVCVACHQLCSEQYALCCTAIYCSERCQHRDWATHKEFHKTQ